MDFAATLPVAAAYDLVVAGGSATGVCAAITAARNGLKVALVEYNAFLGGMATAALVPVWHSLYSTDGGKRIIGGLTAEIEDLLLRRGEARTLEKDNPSVGFYFNVASLQLALDELVTALPGLTLYLKARVAGVLLDAPGRLNGVVIDDKSGLRVLRGRYFIDATGDADLVAQAGLETWAQPREKIQAHTLCAILANAGKMRARHPGFSFEELMKPRRGAGLAHVFQWQAPVIGAPELCFLAATRVTDCNPAVAADLTRALLDARGQWRRIIDAANREFPMPENERLTLVALGSDLGVRESRHIRAEYRLTADDVLYGRRFPDCIARGSYRCDIHEGKGIVFRYLDGREERMEVTAEGEISWRHGHWREAVANPPTWYEIPFRSLLPAGAANLLAAGRMIDCEREAFGAVRVMVNCNQMGEACGAAVAAAQAAGGVDLPALPCSAIVARLHLPAVE